MTESLKAILGSWWLQSPPHTSRFCKEQPRAALSHPRAHGPCPRRARLQTLGHRGGAVTGSCCQHSHLCVIHKRWIPPKQLHRICCAPWRRGLAAQVLLKCPLREPSQGQEPPSLL